jgi:hypothetical protein
MVVVVVILSGIDYQHNNSSGRSNQKTVAVEHWLKSWIGC